MSRFLENVSTKTIEEQITCYRLAIEENQDYLIRMSNPMKIKFREKSIKRYQNKLNELINNK